ncbi:amidohydrolase [Kineococcus sp. SYSU DK001]|uniref:amidohydrolase n=1 Tax=Kineococcus sp. SYSU DK001 TaxID=3383122 RepID=UPI003D7C770C
MVLRPFTRRRLLQTGAAGTAAGIVSASTAPAWAGSSNSSRRGRADTVLVNGQILTVDRCASVASALAVRDGVVVAVGDDAEVRRWIGPRTEVVDLAGRTAIPGINDSHLHLVRTGLAMPPRTIDVGGDVSASIVAVADAVRQAAASAAPGTWIRGKGWNEELFAERRTPTRADLDAAAPDNPVVLLDWSNHQSWVNSKALEVAGVSAATPVPAGGVVVLGADGRPSGIFRETAMALVNAQVPPFTREEQQAAIEEAAADLLTLGITSVTEPGIGAVARSLYEELARSGRLPVRVTALLSRPDDTYPVDVEHVREVLATATPAGGVDPRLFAVRGVKLRADGVPISSRTAWMREEYVGGGRGSLVTVGEDDAAKVAELTAMVRLVHEAGLQIGTHATGDAAIDVVAAAYAAVRRERPGRNPRHYVIHGDFSWPETLAVLAGAGCAVNFNPAIRRLIADSQPAVVGPERAARETPMASALRSGVVVTAASDSPNVSTDWRVGMQSALTRQGTSGAVSGADEAIGFHDALRAFTAAGAWQDGADRWKGSLERGKVGDVCVLGERILDDDGDLRLPAGDFPSVPVAYTLVGGSVVHDGESGAGTAAPASFVASPSPDAVCSHC